MEGPGDRPGAGVRGRRAQPVSTLDVIENFFGETPDPRTIRALSLSELEDLREQVLLSSTAQLQDPVSEGIYYPGGWVAGNWQYQATRGDLNLALLYYPRILVHDPLADFFFDDFDSLPEMRPLREGNNRMTINAGPIMWGQAVSYSKDNNLDRVRSYLTQVIGYMADLAAPAARICSSYATAVANDPGAPVRHHDFGPPRCKNATDARSSQLGGEVG
jgi:hypothetical protein